MAKTIVPATATTGMRINQPHRAVSRARALPALLALCLAATLTGCEPPATEPAGTPPADAAAPAQADATPAGQDKQPPGSGASFDCAKAGSATERLVCAHPDIARLDGQLASAYASALSAVDSSDKPQLRQEQERWIRHTRDLCQDAACLEQVYAARVAVLSTNGTTLSNQVSCETPTGASACVNVVVYRDSNSRIDAFSSLLAEHGKQGRIAGCKRLIDLPAGTAGGNHSFGGYCILEEGSKRTDVRICNDEMVGNFAIEPVEPNREGIKELIDFTSDRCAEG